MLLTVDPALTLGLGFKGTWHRDTASPVSPYLLFACWPYRTVTCRYLRLSAALVSGSSFDRLSLPAFACACWVTAGSAPVVLRVRGRDKSPITLASCRICHLGVPALRSSGPVVSRDSALDLQGRFCGTLYSPLVDSIESHVRLFSF